MAGKKGLSARAVRFADEYPVDLDGQAAAIRAGYSPRSAKTLASQLLADERVQALIKERLAARAERVQIEADDVLRELKIMLKSDVRDYHVDDDGTLTLREGVALEAWRAVASVKHRIQTRRDKDGTEYTTRDIEYRLWSKPEAAKLAGQHLGMYVEKHEHKLPAGGGVLAVPVPMDPAAWAGAAAAQQGALADQAAAAASAVLAAGGTT